MWSTDEQSKSTHLRTYIDLLHFSFHHSSSRERQRNLDYFQNPICYNLFCEEIQLSYVTIMKGDLKGAQGKAT